MAIEEIKPRYKTDDGQEYATKAEAERHQQVRDAREDFECARQKLMRATAYCAMTADGQPFRFERWTYYAVREGGYTYPCVVEVNCYVHNVEVETRSYDGADIISIRSVEYDRDNGRYPPRYDIKNLYSTRRAAQQALLPAIEKWLVLCAEQAALLREQLAQEGITE